MTEQLTHTHTQAHTHTHTHTRTHTHRDTLEVLVHPGIAYQGS